MEIQDYLRLLRKRWRAITAITMLCVAAALALAWMAQPMYRTQVAVFFSVAEGESFNDLAQGGVYSQRQVVSFAELATSPLVLNPVIKDLKLDLTAQELKRELSATIPTNTSIVNVSVTDPDPEQAAVIASTIGQELKSASFRLSPKHSNGSAMVQATITTPATVPDTPISPQPKINLVLGLAVGLGLGIGYAVLRELMDNKVRSDQDVQALTDVPVLGQVALERDGGQGHLIGGAQASQPLTEAFRSLRMGLQFVELAHQARSLCVVSAVPNEGKTTTAINLAISLAQSGSRVLLIDADLRKPSVARAMRLEGSVGLTSVLIGDAGFDDVVQPWGRTSLDVLPAGVRPPNPPDLLGSDAMRRLLADLGSKYDTVILDSPPLLPVSDGFVLARQTDGALLVVGAGSTSKDQFGRALKSLEKFDAPLLGIVVNKVASHYLQDSYYAYESDPSDAGTEASPKLPAPSPSERRKQHDALPVES
ncbi:polysaccharide biosynthesis tyrosine autokinase [Arthrobacter sp. GCM10027362]|uniref:polysaccharide biosynthesis tyrosine autokinase n=1 Tax=Arthrobacter sp. GCM10027362 TaxID=3273379 RepID=UPI0036455D75